MPPSGGCITAERHTGGGGIKDWAASAQWANPGLDLEIKAPWKLFLLDSIPHYRHARYAQWCRVGDTGMNVIFFYDVILLPRSLWCSNASNVSFVFSCFFQGGLVGQNHKVTSLRNTYRSHLHISWTCSLSILLFKYFLWACEREDLTSAEASSLLMRHSLEDLTFSCFFLSFAVNVTLFQRGFC